LIPQWLWRISDYHDLNGEGGLRASGRWHTRGSRIVYLADSPTGALLEILAHLEVDSEDIPVSFSLLKISVPADLEIESFEPPTDCDWRADSKLTRSMGDAWLRAGASPLARVLSSIIAESWNYLLNPEHPDAGQVVVEAVIPERYDQRLLRFPKK
jgi:RES domain-containing protein